MSKTLTRKKKAVHEIIKKHKNAFLLSKTDLGRTEVTKHSIDTGNACTSAISKNVDKTKTRSR